MSVRYFIGLLAMMVSLNVSGVQLVNMKVYIHEEDGTPVEEANVRGTFFQDQVVDSKILSSHQGITDSEGFVELSGHEEIYVDLTVRKDGYYESKKRVNVRGDRGREVSVVLRPKRNPIAMYAKYFKGYIPKNKTKIAFDFVKGDWVRPYGKGSMEDIYFFYEGYSYSFFDYGGELKISFPNESDGLIDMEYKNGYYSELKLPYLAPENGYQMEKILVHKRKGKGASTIKENNLNKKVNYGYFFRVRSELDSDGNVIQANYVKIGGEIVFDPRSEGKGAAYLEMTYYFNPSVNDRNMEFDKKRNLFKSLKHEERVTAP